MPMNWTDMVVILVIAGILLLAVWAICSAKKKGKKCIGCPDSCACSGSNCPGGCTNCQK